MNIYQISDCGGRLENEDSIRVQQEKEYSLMALADGLGGHGNGQLASQTAVETVREMTQRLSAPQIDNPWFENVFLTANQRVLDLKTSECSPKTTLVVLHISIKSMTAQGAHLGDSRLYHFVDGRIAFCTFDHSVSRMAVLAREIAPEEIRFHPDRNKLLKVVGSEEAFLPEYDQCRLDDGLAHAFLLCSDGFWEYVTEEEMEIAYLYAADVKEWVLSMQQILIEKAQGHNNDNYSAIAVVL